MKTLNAKQLRAGRSLFMSICLGVLIVSMYSNTLNAKSPNGMDMSVEQMGSVNELSMVQNVKCAEEDGSLAIIQITDNLMYDVMEFAPFFESESNVMSKMIYIQSAKTFMMVGNFSYDPMRSDGGGTMFDKGRTFMTANCPFYRVTECIVPNEFPFFNKAMMPLAIDNLMGEAANDGVMLRMLG